MNIESTGAGTEREDIAKGEARLDEIKGMSMGDMSDEDLENVMAERRALRVQQAEMVGTAKAETAVEEQESGVAKKVAEAEAVTQAEKAKRLEERKQDEAAQIATIRAEISGTSKSEQKIVDNEVPETQQEKNASRKREVYEEYFKTKETLTGIPIDAWMKIDAYTEDILRERYKGNDDTSDDEKAKEILFNSTDGFYSTLISTHVGEGENGWAKVVDNGESIVGKTLDGTSVVFKGDNLIIKNPDGTSSITKSTYKEVKNRFYSGAKDIILFADDNERVKEIDAKAFPELFLEGYKSAQAEAIKKYVAENKQEVSFGENKEGAAVETPEVVEYREIRKNNIEGGVSTVPYGEHWIIGSVSGGVIRVEKGAKVTITKIIEGGVISGEKGSQVEILGIQTGGVVRVESEDQQKQEVPARVDLIESDVETEEEQQQHEVSVSPTEIESSEMEDNSVFTGFPKHHEGGLTYINLWENSGDRDKFDDIVTELILGNDKSIDNVNVKIKTKDLRTGKIENDWIINGYDSKTNYIRLRGRNSSSSVITLKELYELNFAG